MQDVFRAALTAMQTAFPNASVSVTINGIEGTGLRETLDGDAAAADWGENGQSVSGVRVSMAVFDEAPTRGQTIVVDSDKATVTTVQEDNSGATMLISYNVQQPKDG